MAAGPVTYGTSKAAGRSGSWLGRFVRRQPGGALAGAAVVVIILVAVFAPWLAPYDPLEINFLVQLAPPSGAHPLGTDTFGRDVLSRIIVGARTAVLIGFSAAIVGTTLGALWGAVSAYFGGTFDLLMQRLVDIVIAFPIIIVALAVVAILGPGLMNTIIALTIPIIPKVARVVRSSALVVRETQYIEGARAVGAGHLRVILSHMAPNLVAPYLIMLTAMLGQVILLEASLSFLGLGVVEPTASWGLMLRGAATEYAQRAPWLAIFPGLAITVTVMAFNILGDSLRDVFDPRLRS
ncbi:MAG: ABC transporter permease [Deinococcota bacterium]|jgi:peptide/nickel transport system permease protein|nr:ABC transporter permease [Deinococcota bacterium]